MAAPSTTTAVAAPLYAWMNGPVIPREACVLHGRSAGAFMGANVFEGVRACRSARQGELFVFKHEAYLERLGRSMKTVRLEVPFTLRETDPRRWTPCGPTTSGRTPASCPWRSRRRWGAGRALAWCRGGGSATTASRPG